MEKEARKWYAIHSFTCRGIMEANKLKKQYLSVFCADSSEKAEKDDKLAWEKYAIKVICPRTFASWLRAAAC
jgi:hypothetical protein